LSAVVFTRDIK